MLLKVIQHMKIMSLFNLWEMNVLENECILYQSFFKCNYILPYNDVNEYKCILYFSYECVHMFENVSADMCKHNYVKDAYT